MDNMLGEDKNLKDTPGHSLKDIRNMPSYQMSNSLSVILPFNKINKLITALYMVTDNMDKEEPIRLKLRTLGVEILSDISLTSSLSRTVLDIRNIDQVLSFLNIAHEIGMVSDMNHGILRKEFSSLRESLGNFEMEKSNWLADFIPKKEDYSIGHLNYNNKTLSLNKGQRTRIGVQKASNLMDAIKNIGINRYSVTSENFPKTDFKGLKNKRREEIITIIKDKKSLDGIGGTTITDIKNQAKGILASCGEKTLQRELTSMIKDNVLYKKGTKRWSQYFLKTNMN